MNKQASIPAWQTMPPEKNASFPLWWEASRARANQDFLAAGLPTRKHERFKYTDFTEILSHTFAKATPIDPDILLEGIDQHRMQRGDAILLVLVNGYFIPVLSDMGKLPDKVIAQSLSHALQTHPELVKEFGSQEIDAAKFPFANLNVAQATDGLFFYLPDDCKLDRPLHVLSLTLSQEAFIAHPRFLFVLGKNSKLHLVEEHFTREMKPYFMNMLTTITLDTAAELQHDKIQNESADAFHIAHTFITQKQQSFASCTTFSFGAKLARDDVVVTLVGPHAECRVNGFYHLRYDGQYIDHHLDIIHVAEHTQSEMLYKGIIDKKSRAVFNGRLQVEKTAQKVLAYQANHNLLLAKEAEAYSKPELEIYADDVKCKHGASIGQMDPAAIFYLRARGISESDAVQMLLQGFADEVLNRITHQGVKMRVEENLL